MDDPLVVELGVAGPLEKPDYVISLTKAAFSME